MSGRPYLSITAIFSYCGLPLFEAGRQVRAWQNQHPDDPFPALAGRTQGGRHDLYDRDEVAAWLERCCPKRDFANNRLAQRFIRAEFDRPELQRQYQKLRRRARQRRRAA